MDEAAEASGPERLEIKPPLVTVCLLTPEEYENRRRKASFGGLLDHLEFRANTNSPGSLAALNTLRRLGSSVIENYPGLPYLQLRPHVTELGHHTVLLFGDPRQTPHELAALRTKLLEGIEQERAIIASLPNLLEQAGPANQP